MSWKPCLCRTFQKLRSWQHQILLKVEVNMELKTENWSSQFVEKLGRPSGGLPKAEYQEDSPALTRKRQELYSLKSKTESLWTRDTRHIEGGEPLWKCSHIPGQNFSSLFPQLAPQIQKVRIGLLLKSSYSVGYDQLKRGRKKQRA